MTMWPRLACFAALAACSAAPSPLDDVKPAARARLDPHDVAANVDKIVTDILADTGVPSASVAVVKDGKIAYVHAYGNARLEPKTAATPQMRYAIGSVAKQFTAVAVLLLVADGKLALDDTVGKYVPGLARGDEITIRQVLSHTSGYRDYAPQDYSIPAWKQPTTPAALVAQWAKVDFEPGTKWQYSNTNFTIAGMIVEQVAGKSLFDFLQERVFAKLGMTSVVDVDRGTLAATDPIGYFRRATAPLHPVTPLAPGWKLGGWHLGMTAEDLAKWDISIIDKTILPPAFYKMLASEVVLANGAGTRYALGIGVSLVNQRRTLRHSGEDIGFVSDNVILPDDRLAVVVLTNQDASGAAGDIADKVRDVLVRATEPPNAATEHRVDQLLADFARGALDRGALTDDASAYFTAEAVAEYRDALVAAGACEPVEQTATGRRGGFTFRRYDAKCAKKKLGISVYETDDGKLEQFLIE